MTEAEAREVVVASAGIIDDLTAWIQGIVNTISQELSGIFNGLYNWVRDTVNTFFTWFNNLYTYIKDIFSQIGSFISQFINEALKGLRDAFQRIADFIWQFVEPVVTRIAAWLNDLRVYVLGLIQEGLNFLYGLYVAATDSIKGLVRAVVDSVVEWLRGLVDAAKGAFNTVVKGVEQLYKELVRTIQEAFEKVLGGAGSLIEQIGDRLGGLREAFVESATTVAESISGPLVELPKAFKATVGEYFDLIAAELDPQAALAASAKVQQMFGTGPQAVRDREGFAGLMAEVAPDSPLGSLLFHVFFSVSFAMSAYQGIGGALAQQLLQEFAAQYPYQVLQPPDAIAAALQGSIGQDQAVEMIKRSGYSETDARALYKSAEAVPPTGELLAMKLRGLVSPEGFSSAMKRQGFTETWQQAYTQLAEVIPPVGDLITMAVHGAFSDEETALFRTDEDFPESILPHTKKQGLDETWTRKYWRAHWNLPSPTQGFEMFQRSIIEPEQLTTLLKALDIAPFWRDKLIKLNYQPLTRVDVRRMNQLGILKHAGVVKAYRDLGYSPENAESLATFTEMLNQGLPSDNDAELGRISRTTVLNWYEDGLVDQARAVELLTGMGNTPEAAQLYVIAKDHEAERTERKLQIDTTIDLAKAGSITFDAAQDRLTALGLETVEVARALAKLAHAQATSSKLPTQQQGAQMMIARVITEAEYLDLLARLGYSQKWAHAFVQLAKAGKDGGTH